MLVPQKISLRHNTLFLLGPETNRLFLHSIKKNKGEDGIMEPRISITFRDLATCYAHGGDYPAFYGQGTQFVNHEELQRAVSRQTVLGQLCIVASTSAAFVAVIMACGKEKRRPSSGLAALTAAGITGASSWLFVRWKKRRDWQNQQGRLAQVYRQCNILALTSEDARELLLYGTKKELAFQLPKVTPNACARDS